MKRNIQILEEELKLKEDYIKSTTSLWDEQDKKIKELTEKLKIITNTHEELLNDFRKHVKLSNDLREILKEKLNDKINCFNKLVIAGDCNSKEVVRLTNLNNTYITEINQLKNRNLWKRILNK